VAVGISVLAVRHVGGAIPWLLSAPARKADGDAAMSVLSQASDQRLMHLVYLVGTAEHACYDPKDSELCLARTKPQETGVEVRSRCDVQIHGVSWA